MSLILALEPNRRQASQLKSLVNGRLRAELVLADTTARALSAIGSRVPDLILASPLISHQDEVAIAAWLRELGSAGAHLQTVTIPILASSGSEPTKRGMLSALRRGKPVTAVDGCDPAVFAEQILLYLDRAAAEQQARLADPRSAKQEVTAAAPTADLGDELLSYEALDIEEPAEPLEELLLRGEQSEEQREEQPAPVVEEPILLRDEPAGAEAAAGVEMPLLQTSEPAATEQEAIDPVPAATAGPVVALPAKSVIEIGSLMETDDIQTAAPLVPFVPSAATVRDFASLAGEPERAPLPDLAVVRLTGVALPNAPDEAPLLELANAPTHNFARTLDFIGGGRIESLGNLADISRDFEVALPGLASSSAETLAPIAQAPLSQMSALEPLLAGVEPPVRPQVEPESIGRDNKTDWFDLSLQDDADASTAVPERAAPALAPAPITAPAPAPAPAPALIDEDIWVLTPAADDDDAGPESGVPDRLDPAPAGASRSRHANEQASPDKSRFASPVTETKRKPAKDEWGLFDPEQCGFAALAKFDGAGEDNAMHQRLQSSVRVIGY